MKSVQPVAGVALTFEQQKELLILQHKHELEREERALEQEQAIRAQEQAAEIERLKCNVW